MVLPDAEAGLSCRHLDVMGCALREARGCALGACVPGFAVEGALGEGGMGAVYRGRELATGKVVALKTLRACHAGDEGRVRRFEREIAFAMRVVHPNVAPVLGAGKLGDGRPYYLMELYRGRTLGALVREEGPLELGLA